MTSLQIYALYISPLLLFVVAVGGSWLLTRKNGAERKRPHS
jgi:hypothetical protein